MEIPDFIESGHDIHNFRVHKASNPMLPYDQAIHRQRSEGFTDSRATHAQLLREIRLRWQPRVFFQVDVLNNITYLRGNALESGHLNDHVLSRYLTSREDI